MNTCRLDTINNNCHILIRDTIQICFSYEIPAAIWISNKGYFQVDFISVTTSKHINLFYMELSGRDKKELVKQGLIQLVDTSKLLSLISENL